jgi:hypothetical protein
MGRPNSTGTARSAEGSAYWTSIDSSLFPGPLLNPALLAQRALLDKTAGRDAPQRWCGVPTVSDAGDML